MILSERFDVDLAMAGGKGAEVVGIASEHDRSPVLPALGSVAG